MRSMWRLNSARNTPPAPPAMIDPLSFQVEARPVVQGITRILREPRWQPVLAGAIVAASLFYLSYWAGVPERGLPAFFIGIAALVGLTLACGAVAWPWVGPGAPPEGSAPGGRRR